MIAKSVLAVLPLVGFAQAHGSFWHKSMYGFNVTATNSPQYGSRDNRPQAPLRQLPFSQWWMHGHLDQPPHPDDVFELPAGGTAVAELACDKDATSWWPSGPGGDQQNGDDPCPGPPSKLIHANNINDLGGCALAIAYKSDVNDVKPEDLVVFSVNHQCIWNRFTNFPVPAQMPACPNGKCICAWLWQHREDAGGDEMYMNGFQCSVTGATATTPIPQGKVAVKCADDASKCVKGPKTPFYWDQAENNNIFNGIYEPPLYLDSFGFANGAQNDLWDSVQGSSNAAAKSSSSAATSTSQSTSAAAAVTTSVSVASQAPASTSASLAPAVVTSSPAEPAVTSTVVTPAAAAAITSVVSSSVGGKVQAASYTTSSSPTKSKGGQGHRTCRPKKNKKSARDVYGAARHRSRRARAF
ncbi:hypothetical protein BDV93DRAFT_489341 [Ceratobasidium sp. AG-I]|nr:hypothetical protein BDV93DRAFT_489341 [Ceratobasidium sp. AG-I]